MLKKIGPLLDLTVRIALHGAILFLALPLLKPAKITAHPQMTASLWSGLDKIYIVPGAQFKIFKPYLPKESRVSLILDRPNDATTKDKEISYDAQNYLAPRIINLETIEPVALVYCSTQAIAEQRLAETGYEWTHRIAAGKGMARKIV